MHGRQIFLDRAILTLLTLLGLAVRIPGIARQPLQWDEGWSIALARLPAADALRVTALDVHPPLYYLMLNPWIGAIGTSPFAVRALSILFGALTIPLAAAAARAWWPSGAANAWARRWAGWGAAAATALAPPLVYYAGVGRMYAPAAAGVAAAAWGVAVWLDVANANKGASARRRRRLGLVAGVTGSAGALLSFYYSGFALAGVGLAAIVARPQAWRGLLVWVGATSALVAPWLYVALPPLAERISARVATGESPVGEFTVIESAQALLVPLADAWRAALFVNTGGALLAAAVLVALMWALVDAIFATPDRALSRGRLAATVLPITLVCVAAALGARAHMFAPRYVSVATPFVALGIAWAAAGAVRNRRTAWLAAVALLAASAPTLSGAIHTRSAEWFDEYDPGELHRALVELARPGDVAAFNILSLAGAYDSAAEAYFREGGRSPSWTYAQLWDPVHEPIESAIQRVEALYERALQSPSPPATDPESTGEQGQGPGQVPGQGQDQGPGQGAAAGASALWLVLYKGTAASDSAELKAWADDNYFPLSGRWVGDTLVAGYVEAPVDRAGELGTGVDFGHGIKLTAAQHTSRTVTRGNVGIRLTWRAKAVPDVEARVVIRLVDDISGRVVTQRDAVPVVASRPTLGWEAGESIEDWHGMRVPEDASGALRIVVALVNAATDEIVYEAEVGRVEVAGGGAASR